jgi:ribosomal protein L30E
MEFNKPRNIPLNEDVLLKLKSGHYAVGAKKAYYNAITGETTWKIIPTTCHYLDGEKVVRPRFISPVVGWRRLP